MHSRDGLRVAAPEHPQDEPVDGEGYYPRVMRIRYERIDRILQRAVPELGGCPRAIDPLVQNRREVGETPAPG